MTMKIYEPEEERSYEAEVSEPRPYVNRECWEEDGPSR